MKALFLRELFVMRRSWGCVRWQHLLSICLWWLTVGRRADAELLEEAQRLANIWQQEGLEVERKGPLFLDQGRPRTLPLSSLDKAPVDGACTTIALLAVRGLELAVLFPGVDGALVYGPAQGPRVERSLAGLATVVRCGDDRRELGQTAVEMRAARGTVEVIVARGNRPASPARDVLTERAVPLPRPLPDPGRAPGREDLPARIRRVEDRAKREQAATVSRDVIRASLDGSGRVLFGLSPGCHRVELLALLGPHQQVLDVDAELREAWTNRLLARDRSDTPDVRLDVCAAEPSSSLLSFGGAPPAMDMALVDSMWPLPVGLPPGWSARTRAAMAKAMFTRRGPRLTEPPVQTTLGVSGTTLFPVEVEPDRCYVGVAATVRGDPRVLRLAVTAGSLATSSDTNPAADGVMVSFCARRTTRAAVQVDARGSGISWLFALWPVGHGPPEEAPFESP